MPETHTHPIHNLPPECVAKIFSLVFPKGTELVRRNPYPWRIALVCRLWRDIVYSTPKLWSNVTVWLDPLRMSRIDIRGDTLVAAWMLCLSRSGDCSLTVDIDASTRETMAFVPSLLEPLMEHVGRWEKVKFGFPINLLIPFISDSSIRYPRLRRFGGRGRDGSILTNERPPQIQLFPNAPLLSTLHLSEFSYAPLGLRFPWSQITELTMYMSEGNAHDLLDGLRHTPNLSNLSFARYYSTSSDAAGTHGNQSLELPYLQKLSWITYMFNSTLLFDSLVAPRLSEIEFQCDDGSWNPGAVGNFLRRSKCKVTSLKLNSTSPHIAAAFIRMLPDVEVVTLHAVTSDTDLMHALTYDEAAPFNCVCLKIREIVLHNISFKEECREDFVLMVQSRLRIPEDGKLLRIPPRKLDSLRIMISVYPGTDKSLTESLRAYKLLRERLSPGEMASVMYEEHVMGE
ncbi:hypothetical protein P691DRAFT_577663 [Macrolepiota fuliginosa MF-IS2]|uniref:F-box domain-containing protein n=1 Tax=Macrolepiota fuliginosa MF-IS2 TaxID=1400762 RepID=A0A9P6C2N8_9AGAR|nr:hypothetical protein P691DRAFT_577663 [Macrolepiota fuliginosa MF-IS2]